ncbi:hypothetical protein PM082_015556 [Marasmius tenuissimus]|nr:hypothetical protein PM082_015556 [Marasmius tenuissimus]
MARSVENVGGTVRRQFSTLRMKSRSLLTGTGDLPLPAHGKTSSPRRDDPCDDQSTAECSEIQMARSHFPSTGISSSSTPPPPSDEHGMILRTLDSSTSSSTTEYPLRNGQSRSARARASTGELADFEANPQKSIRVAMRPAHPQDVDLDESYDDKNSTSVDRKNTPVPTKSMSHVMKVTKRPSLSLSLSTHTFANASNVSLSTSNTDSDSPLSIHIDSPSPSSPRTNRMLRRKGTMQVLRRSAPLPDIPEPLLPQTPPSTPRPQSQPISCPPPRSTLTHIRNSSSTSIPITSFQAHARSYSQPNTARLGHPSRPYYSAMRKNMSSPSPDTARPALPPPSPPPSSFAFPQYSTLTPQGQKQRQSAQDLFAIGSDLVPLRSHSPKASYSYSYSMGRRTERHKSAPALSRKEEMEMRLALARDVRGDLEDLDVGRQPGASDTLKRKVSKLRKGFKDMWRRRT